MVQTHSELHVKINESKTREQKNFGKIFSAYHNKQNKE